jgi:hypothetical protein
MLENISYDQIKFEVKVNDGKKHTFIMNHKTHSIPDNLVVWDAFGTNNWYVNLPTGKTISEIHSNVYTILTTFYSDKFDEGVFNLKNPDSNDKLVSWANRYKHDNFDGWSFDRSLLFTLSEDYSSVPVCSNFTGTVNNVYIVSKKYAFANKISSYVCSSPKVVTNKLEPSFCPYATSQCQCPFYEPVSEIIKSDSVTHYGSETLTQFELSASPTLGFSFIYTIKNKTLDETCTVIASPNRTEETDINAIDIYNEMLNIYVDSFSQLKEVDLSEPSQNDKNSYILSLS